MLGEQVTEMVSRKSELGCALAEVKMRQGAFIFTH